MSDITLTASMRSNLINLQQTTQLLGRTQERLSTGKKVNSALDNPVNFFAAQSLNNRANDLAGYKDGMANAVQTIKAANQGIDSITTLLNAAKALATSVPGKTGGTNDDTATLTLTGVQIGDTVSIDNITLTATAATQDAANFIVGATDSETAMNLKTAIDASASTINVTSINGSSLSLAKTGTDLAVGVGAGKVSAGAGVTSFNATIVPKNGEVDALNAQYDSILSQISDMANDSSFQGINLLATGITLSVSFGNGHKLDIDSQDASFGGLGLTQGPGWTGATTDGQTQIADIDAALTKLRTISTSLSNNLAIINARQDFSTQLGNVLTTGADNLTLADTNEEGANMLMLQTRNSLGTTALSLSSQAAQSVLRLFG